MAWGDSRKAEAIVAASNPKHRLQDQGRANAGIDGRMCASEHQPQAIIGYRGFARLRCGKLFGNQLHGDHRPFAAQPPSHRIDLFVARHCEQPGFRFLGRARRRPFEQGGGERLGQRILGPRHIASPGGEKGNELAVAAPGNILGCSMGRLVAFFAHQSSIGHTGRTSTAP